MSNDYRHTSGDLAKHFNVTRATISRYAVKYRLGLKFGGHAGRRFSDEDIRNLTEELRPADAVPARRRRRLA